MIEGRRKYLLKILLFYRFVKLVDADRIYIYSYKKKKVLNYLYRKIFKRYNLEIIKPYEGEKVL